MSKGHRYFASQMGLFPVADGRYSLVFHSATVITATQGTHCTAEIMRTIDNWLPYTLAGSYSALSYSRTKYGITLCKVRMIKPELKVVKEEKERAQFDRRLKYSLS